MNRQSFCQSPVLAWVLVCAAATPTLADSPFASEVIEYVPGTPEPWLNDPANALGSPTRFTGIGIFPAVVSVFNPPWSDGDLVSIAAGGHLVLRFDEPIVDDAAHPFGIDLLIFGNTGFEDVAYPTGLVGGVFSDDGGTVEVSADGVTWHLVPEALADGLFPTLGYLDSGPYDTEPGKVEADFTRPVDPALSMDDFLGLGHEQVLALYDGSGGGSGIDIAAAGLSQVQFVRISNPVGAVGTIEIDALAKVAPALTGDLNGDGAVDVSDLLVLLAGWGGCPTACPADLDGNGTVDVSDLLILLANWG